MADKKGVLSMVGDVTGAQATLMQGAMRGRGGARRAKRRKTSVKTRSPKRSKARSNGSPKKGSAAMKRRMAKLRKMRKK